MLSSDKKIENLSHFFSEELDSFWVISKGGKCLYTFNQRNQKVELNTVLMGGMISVLVSISEMMTSRNLSEVRLDDLNFYIRTYKNLIIASILGGNIDSEFVNGYLDRIIISFYELYKDKIEDPGVLWKNYSNEFSLYLRDNLWTEEVKESIMTNITSSLVKKYLNSDIKDDKFFDKLYELAVVFAGEKRQNFLSKAIKIAGNICSSSKNGNELKIEKLNTVLSFLQDYNIKDDSELITQSIDEKDKIFDFSLYYKSNYYNSELNTR